jgi:hypothetical protein
MSPGAVLGDHVRELQQIVGDIAFWKTGPDIGSGVDERTFLELDMARLGELAEAWVPVSTAYGPAVLVFPNCD